MIELNVCELRDAALSLKAGDAILLSGTLYTARDAAHKRFAAALAAGKPLPFPIQNAAIYYAGPTPAQNGLPIGSIGPTTSARMDPYAPALYDRGIVATIGKGTRSPAVREALIRNKALYLCALGGAGALACKAVRRAETVAYPDLGCESVKRLEVIRFPLFVAGDIFGGSIYPDL